MNWTLYIVWAETILQIAAQLLPTLNSGQEATPEEALKAAHDLVQQHAKNLVEAKNSLSSDSGTSLAP